jgi:hypothetical protein
MTHGLPGGAKIRISLSGWPIFQEEDHMGRKRTEAAAAVSGNTQGVEHERRPRRVRKLAVLLAVAGGTLYLVRRNQRRASIDEGVWHEAPGA